MWLIQHTDIPSSPFCKVPRRLLKRHWHPSVSEMRITLIYLLAFQFWMLAIYFPFKIQLYYSKKKMVSVFQYDFCVKFYLKIIYLDKLFPGNKNHNQVQLELESPVTQSKKQRQLKWILKWTVRSCANQSAQTCSVSSVHFSLSRSSCRSYQVGTYQSFENMDRFKVSALSTEK